MSEYNTSRGTIYQTFVIGDASTGSYISLTGSTKFGDTADDTHQFTGSIYCSESGSISGSLDVFGSSKFGAAGGTDFHQFTGSVFCSGTGSIQGNLSIFGSSKFGAAGGTDFHQFTGSVSTTSILTVGSYATFLNNTLQLRQSDAETGLGTTSHLLNAPSNNNPLVLDNQATGRDTANGVVIASVFDRNAASVTNASTVRVHAFGWTSNTNAFKEQASIRANGDAYFVGSGSFGGNVNVTGSLIVGATDSKPSVVRFAGLFSSASAPVGTVGDLGLCTDGDAGAMCLAIFSGSNWYRITIGSTLSTT